MRRAFLAIVVVGVSLAGSLGAWAARDAGPVKLEATLRGANERPAAPGSDRGRVEVRVNARTGRVCWEFTIRRIDGRPLQAHIHKGRRGVSGNVVVPLGANYARQGCTRASKATARAILRHPGAYYVNVHNAKHPLGAMRGQLARHT